MGHLQDKKNIHFNRKMNIHYKTDSYATQLDMEASRCVCVFIRLFVYFMDLYDCMIAKS